MKRIDTLTISCSTCLNDGERLASMYDVTSDSKQLAPSSICESRTLIFTGEASQNLPSSPNCGENELGLKAVVSDTVLITENGLAMTRTKNMASEDQTTDNSEITDQENLLLDHKLHSSSSFLSSIGHDTEAEDMFIDVTMTTENANLVTTDKDKASEVLRVDGSKVMVQEDSFIDDRFQRRILKPPAVQSMDISDSAIHKERDERTGNMLVEPIDRNKHVKEVSMGDLRDSNWLPCWDSYYSCYYFYNVETEESKWEPPVGFEPYASISSIQSNKLDNVARSQLTTDMNDDKEAFFQDDFEKNYLPYEFSSIDLMSRSPNDDVRIIEDGDASKSTSKYFTLSVMDVSADENASFKSSSAGRVNQSIRERGNDLTVSKDVTSFVINDSSNLKKVEGDALTLPSSCLYLHEVVRRSTSCLADHQQMVVMTDSDLKDERFSLLQNPENNTDFSSFGNDNWSVYWDAHYGRYYFYNTKTLECTWQPPTGYEAYAGNEYSADQSGNHGEAEVPFVNSFKADSLQSVDCPFLDAIDPENQKINIEKESEEQVDLDSQNSICDDITNRTVEADAVNMEGVNCKASRVKSRAKKSAQYFIQLANQHVDAGTVSPMISKYWFQRFHLFSKYELGVKLDEEGWFSVTPEAIAKQHALRCRQGSVVVDAFVGVGGNAIQFALAGHYVIAIDSDPRRIEYAYHNAQVYGVADRIDFVLGDFFSVSSSISADVIFLAPPWGGPQYLDVDVYDILTMLQPKDGLTLLNLAHSIAPNIIFFLPRNVDINQLSALQKMVSFSCSCEVERNFLNGKLKAVTAYFGQFESIVNPEITF
ncbi:hypothetical protein KP509_17G030300 [Ceratopteris richardii]|nr:hypothetical protein KP509_17G030300 [Ceratopteris richardii]